MDNTPDVQTTDHEGIQIVGYNQNMDRANKWIDDVKWVEYPRVERKIIDGSMAMLEIHCSFRKDLDPQIYSRQHCEICVVREGKIIRKDAYFTDKKVEKAMG